MTNWNVRVEWQAIGPEATDHQLVAIAQTLADYSASAGRESEYGRASVTLTVDAVNVLIAAHLAVSVVNLARASAEAIGEVVGIEVLDEATFIRRLGASPVEEPVI